MRCLHTGLRRRDANLIIKGSRPLESFPSRSRAPDCWRSPQCRVWPPTFWISPTWICTCLPVGLIVGLPGSLRESLKKRNCSRNLIPFQTFYTNDFLTVNNSVAFIVGCNSLSTFDSFLFQVLVFKVACFFSLGGPFSPLKDTRPLWKFGTFKSRKRGEKNLKDLRWTPDLKSL